MARVSPIHTDLGPELPDYKRARRSQIVQAALVALKEHDYDQIQMRDVAERAGVALGTLYRYFSSKEHVYAAVLMEWAQPVFVAAESDSQPAELRLRTKVRAIVASFERRPGFFRVCQLLQNSADHNAQQMMQQFADIAVRALANDFAALGEPADADTAWMLWGIINTLLGGALQGMFPMADTYRITDSFLDLVMPQLPADQRH